MRHLAHVTPPPKGSDTTVVSERPSRFCSQPLLELHRQLKNTVAPSRDGHLGSHGNQEAPESRGQAPGLV